MLWQMDDLVNADKSFLLMTVNAIFISYKTVI